MQKEAGKDGPSRTPVLSVQNVSYWYGAKQALDDVSFDVYPGRVTALLGPNAGLAHHPPVRCAHRPHRDLRPLAL